MRAVVSTVSEASVEVDGQIIAAVTGPAALALVGAGREDSPDAAVTMARKIAELRIFPPLGEDLSSGGRRDASAADVDAEILVVSQFTLMGATAKGRRPSWSAAAAGDQAERAIAAMVAELRSRNLRVSTGRFGATMRVASVNEGPFTVLIDT